MSIVRASRTPQPGPSPRPRIYTTSETVKVDNQAVTGDGQTFRITAGGVVELFTALVDAGGQALAQLDQVALGLQGKSLVIPISKVLGGTSSQRIDEVYFVVTLSNGEFRATGQLPVSGNWKILPDRVAAAMAAIGLDFDIDFPPITLLA